ncbi:MAG: hypothetical protein WAU36_03735 [Cyclobacteriaceae bacterium]
MKQEQDEMNKFHNHGATGVIVSGFVWLTTSVVAFHYSSQYAIWTLLVGGALIHPVSILVNRLIGITGNPEKSNSMVGLALEGTIFMLMCIPLAYGLSLQRPEWFFYGMLMIIGGRYLTFNTIYGNRLFWVLGASLGLSGYLLFTLDAKPFVSVLTGSFIELSFGVLILSRKKKV